MNTEQYNNRKQKSDLKTQEKIQEIVQKNALAITMRTKKTFEEPDEAEGNSAKLREKLEIKSPQQEQISRKMSKIMQNKVELKSYAPKFNANSSKVSEGIEGLESNAESSAAEDVENKGLEVVLSD